MFTQQLIAETTASIADSTAEPSLNDSEATRRLLEKHTGFAQFRVLLSGTVLWSNAAAKMRGGDTSAPLEDAVRAYVPEDRARIIDTITVAIRERKGFRFTARRMDGKQTKVIEVIGDIKIEDDVVTELFGLTRDVSSSVEREALGISRARLIRRMVEDMPVPIVVLDRALRVVACSSAWVRSYGLASRSEALGKHVNQFAMLGRETTSAIITAMHGETAQVTLPFYGAEDGRQVMRRCVVVPGNAGRTRQGAC